MFHTFKNILLDIFFPPICLICSSHLAQNERENHICTSCHNNIELQKTLFCPACRARLPTQAGLPVQKICHLDSYLIGSATTYDNEVVKKLIWELKYGKQRVASRALGAILARYIAQLAYPFKNPLLVPIPLHSSRERMRGFNQSEIIARKISKTLSIPLATNILFRTRATTPQPETKSYEERAHNVAGCFAIRNPELFRGKQIILIDDVFTSSATMQEAVTTLRAKGARNIIAFTVTRAG